MTDNMAIWDKVEKTPGEAAKSFNTGDYSGTSANTTYNAKRATELFGPYGIGWRVEIEMDNLTNLGTEEAPHYIHTLRIAVHYHHEGKDGIARGYGQTPASYMTKNGYRKVDGDYAKKSMTDALSKALQFMGFSADIWLGMWDDNKYVQERREEFKEAKRQQAAKNGNGYQNKYVKPQPKNEQAGNDDGEPRYDPETGEIQDTGVDRFAGLDDMPPEAPKHYASANEMMTAIKEAGNLTDLAEVDRSFQAQCDEMKTNVRDKLATAINKRVQDFHEPSAT